MVNPKRGSDKQYRSSETGEFVDEEEAKKHPATTYSMSRSDDRKQKLDVLWEDYERRQASRMFAEEG